MNSAAVVQSERKTALMTFVSWDTLMMIDEHRGSRSREEFVETCLKSTLSNFRGRSPYRGDVPLNETSAAWNSGAKSDVGRKGAIGVGTPKEAGETKMTHGTGTPLPGTIFSADPLYRRLWYFALATFGVGDLVTTMVALNMGLTELNPLVSGLGSFAAVALLKLSVMTGIFVASYAGLHSRRAAYAAPAVTAFVGCMLILNNSMMILGV